MAYASHGVRILEIAAIAKISIFGEFTDADRINRLFDIFQ